MKITNNKKKNSVVRVESLMDELNLARQQAKALRERITSLNRAVEKAGGDPERKARIARNKSIYKSWKDGHKFSHIAKEFNLTPSTVGTLCHRIERVLERKHSNFKEYKDLLPYK